MAKKHRSTWADQCCFRLLGRNRAIPGPNQADVRLLNEDQGMGSLHSDPGNVGR